jgi:molybdate transport system substrate-binding protein
MKHTGFATTLLVGAAAVATLMTGPAYAQSGELRVLCSNGIRAAVEQLRPQAESTIGRKISIEFSASTVLKKEIDAGAPFDLTILTPGIVDDLAKSGKVVAGSQTNLASADIGVGIKAGSPKVDISTPEGMKKRLLAAKSITWTDGGAASGATAAMLKGLGIEDQLKSRIVLQKTPGHAAESVAAGQNELIFGPVSEIQTVPGAEVLGLFPKKYQKPVVMTAALGARAKDAAAAKALVAFLTSAKAVPAIKASGMKPASK